MIPTYTRFAATTAGPTATKGPVMPPFDGRKGPHESVKRPTAWSTRKSAAKGISPVYAWPLTLAFVGAGAFYMYSAFGHPSVGARLGPREDGADLMSPTIDRSGGLVSALTGMNRQCRISPERTWVTDFRSPLFTGPLLRPPRLTTR